MKEKWQMEVVNAIGGPALLKIRKGPKSGTWKYPPFTAGAIPDYVKNYLNLMVRAAGRVVYLADFKNLTELLGTTKVSNDVKWNKPHYVNKKPFRAIGVFEVEVPANVVDQRKRVKRLGKNKKAIFNLLELARHVGVFGDLAGTEEDLIKHIAHRLYKDTSCGIGFSATKDEVSVSGYCEGTDAECPNRTLPFPFLPKKFDDMVDAADEDGNDLWDATHGCDECGEADYETGYTRVNPKCKGCGGDGVII